MMLHEEWERGVAALDEATISVSSDETRACVRLHVLDPSAEERRTITRTENEGIGSR